MKSKNIILNKSFYFAIELTQIYFAIIRQKEFILSKQLLKSGTSIGALTREAAKAESKSDFIHKMHIALKEANETMYWIEVLERIPQIEIELAKIKDECSQIIKILSSIILTAKQRYKPEKHS